MVGMVQIMTQAGMRELPFYVDNRDVANDLGTGVLKINEEIVYRDFICVALNDFTDEDGCRYAELLVVDGTGVSFVQMNQMGNGSHRVEFTMG